MWLWVILILVVALAAYVRLAPSDPARWHQDVTAEQDKDFAGGAIRVVQVDLAAMDKVIRESGARVLSGSVQEGHITYISRTRIAGFPDYVTVQKHGDTLRIFSRLRFGKSDLGVNKRRVEGWLSQL